MGHKRHRIKGDFTNVNPGRGGPGITEDGYPPHLVVSIEHPELNPQGITVETFTEEVPEEVFGTNVGEVIENFINQNNNNPSEEDIMNNEHNNTNENINNQQENPNMNTNPNVNPDNGTIDDGSNNNSNNTKPSLAKEAASAFIVGAAYGAGTVCAVIGISLLVSGIHKLCSGDATTADDATATTAETTETVAEALIR